MRRHAELERAVPTHPTQERALIESDIPLESRWRAIAAKFPDALRPATEELRQYQTGQFPYDRAACLANADAGGFDETGFGISERDSTDLNTDLAAYLCAARFPIVGPASSITPLSEAEVSRLYDRLVEYSACVVQSGEPVAPLLDRAAFEQLWPAVGPLPQPDPGITSAIDWSPTSRACAEPMLR